VAVAEKRICSIAVPATIVGEEVLHVHRRPISSATQLSHDVVSQRKSMYPQFNRRKPSIFHIMP